jgi:hypothetical protein
MMKKFTACSGPIAAFNLISSEITYSQFASDSNITSPQGSNVTTALEMILNQSTTPEVSIFAFQPIPSTVPMRTLHLLQWAS